MLCSTTRFYSRPKNLALNCDLATSNGFFNLLGRRNSSPEQLGHIESKPVLQDSQKVHSKEQIYAISLALVDDLQCSHSGFIFNIIYTYSRLKLHHRKILDAMPYQLVSFLFIRLKDSGVTPR